MTISPVELKVAVTGSKSSALVNPSLLPPVINTLPFGRRVAVWPPRGAVILPMGLKAPGACALTDSAEVGNAKTSTRMSKMTLADGQAFSFVGPKTNNGLELIFSSLKLYFAFRGSSSRSWQVNVNGLGNDHGYGLNWVCFGAHQNTTFSCTHMLRMPLSVKSRFRKRPGGVLNTFLCGTFTNC